ncbi:hypothetical protein [Bhargavaea cecembensis]|uniref:hypothetical protein n=1 Tax=Bhargavaea cecembensis TaxID=394098 RepID=UPI0012E87D58|nr:hypothetical protein [Bhargavaea cecembensis]
MFTPDLETESKAYAQWFVEQHLKAPSTAEFNWDNEAVEIDDDVWQVTGSVDSENSFGGMIRSNYTVEVRYKGDNDWELLNIYFD